MEQKLASFHRCFFEAKHITNEPCISRDNHKCDHSEEHLELCCQSCKKRFVWCKTYQLSRLNEECKKYITDNEFKWIFFKHNISYSKTFDVLILNNKDLIGEIFSLYISRSNMADTDDNYSAIKIKDFCRANDINGFSQRTKRENMIEISKYIFKVLDEKDIWRDKLLKNNDVNNLLEKINDTFFEISLDINVYFSSTITKEPKDYKQHIALDDHIFLVTGEWFENYFLTIQECLNLLGKSGNLLDFIIDNCRPGKLISLVPINQEKQEHVKILTPKINEEEENKKTERTKKINDGINNDTPFANFIQNIKKESESELLKSRSRPTKIREQVWTTYSKKYTAPCYVCSTEISSFSFECGHVESIKMGGTDQPCNLKPVCGSCNKSMGTENMEDYKKRNFPHDNSTQNNNNINKDKVVTPENGNINVGLVTLDASKPPPLISKKPQTISKKHRTVIWDTHVGESKRQGNCYSCNNVIDITDFDCGHVVSKKNGGSDEKENIRPICRSCNLSCGTQNLDDFKKSLGASPPSNIDNKFISSVLMVMPACVFTGCSNNNEITTTHVHQIQGISEKEYQNIKNYITIKKSLLNYFNAHMISIDDSGNILKIPGVKQQCIDLKDINKINPDYYDFKKLTNKFWDNHRQQHEDKY